MNRQQVIEKLCEMCSAVGGLFGHKIPHDCICEPETRDFQFSPQIIEYFEACLGIINSMEPVEVKKTMITESVFKILKGRSVGDTVLIRPGVWIKKEPNGFFILEE